MKVAAMMIARTKTRQWFLTMCLMIKAETDKIATRENILQSNMVLFSLGAIMNKRPLCPWDPCFLTPALLWFHWGTRCAYIC